MKYNMFPILLATTFLSTSAIAQTVPTINTDFLNSLTGEKVTWEDASASGEDTVQIGDKYYKYTYNKPEGYSETSTRINDTLASADVTDVVFKDIYNENYGGAIYNTQDNSNVGINADFVSNYTNGRQDPTGSAILNYGNIANIVGDFIGNYAESFGGAVTNYGVVGNIIGDFIDNSAGDGGAICNFTHGSGIIMTMGDILGDFIGNKAITNYSYYSIHGGAIYNEIWYDSIINIGNIEGSFVGNSAYANGQYSSASGGAIYNHANVNGYNIEGTIIIGNIKGNFIENYALSINSSALGGAIYNYAYGSVSKATSSIGNIEGNFIRNYSILKDYNDSYAYGGAIYNYSDASSSTKSLAFATIGNIVGNFIENNTSSIGGEAKGGAVYNYALASADYYYPSEIGYATASIGHIFGDFIGNYVASVNNVANGGAIYNYAYADVDLHAVASIDNISGSFLDNYAKSTLGIALGGAIYTNSDLTFKADGETHLFTGNYTEDSRGKINNAIWINNYDTSSRPFLTFNIMNGGAFVFDDEIDGGDVKALYDDNWNIIGYEIVRNNNGYNINLSGDAYNTDKMDETNTIRFNDLVNNVYDFSIDSVQMALGKSAVINVTHNYIAKNNPYLRLDLDAVNREVGQINIDGDVDGTTNVIVNVLQNKETAKEESIVFATAQNDTLGGDDSFKIYRVIGSPYMWEVSYNDTNKQWGLYSTKEQNPDEEDAHDVPTPDTPVQPLGPIKVAPEVIATVAVKTAGLSQTNGMIYNIMRKVGINHLYCPGCGFYDYNWNGKTLHNAWTDTTYNGLTIEAPVEIEAKVWGIEAGSDLQHDLNNKLGIFVSYRQGNYEMDGTGEKYYSNIGSEIDIDSYLAGLYYRYDKNNWYAFATVYGGMQNAEIKTDDGVSADTDGIEFGGSIEAGYSYALTGTLSATPSLGVFYSQISYDDATDSVGKTVNYNDLKQVELEAGIKFSQAEYLEDGFYAVYVKPSVVQTLIDGDEIEVTKLGKVDTVEDKTLGRIEIGGNYGFNDNWSAYGWANYTFGSDYEATSLGLGLNYAW